MKQVFDTDTVPHLWINERQSSARNPGGNLSFSGRSMYSYSTIVAEIYEKDHNIVFITTHSYSVTTSKQMGIIRRAIPSYKKEVYVSEPANIYEYSPNFWKNIEHWKSAAIYSMQNSLKDKIRQNTRIQHKQDAVNSLQCIVDFIAIFGLTVDTLKNICKPYGHHADKNKQMEIADFKYLVSLVKGRDTILTGETVFLDQYQKAKDKAEKQRNIARQKEREKQQKEAQKYLDFWLAGETIGTHHLRPFDKIYLRAMPKDKAKVVETSHGASVSIKEAKLLYLAMKSGKSILGREIDGYTVVEHTPEHLTIGCHKLLKEEIERFAALMKW